MRHLIDTYIEAAEPARISDFGEIGLLDLIVKSGMVTPSTTCRRESRATGRRSPKPSPTTSAARSSRNT